MFVPSYRIVEDTADCLGITDLGVFSWFVIELTKKSKLADLIEKRVWYKLHTRWAKTRQIPEEMLDYCIDVLSDRPNTPPLLLSAEDIRKLKVRRKHG